MGVRELGAALVDLVLPGDCAGCGEPGPPWCHRCAARLGPPTWPLVPGGPHVLAAGRYTGPLRTALLRYKERGRRDLSRPLAQLLVAPLELLLAGRQGVTWLVPAPSRPSAARARGGDHVLRLCHALASGRDDIAVAGSLQLTRWARDSVGLDAAQRAANLAGRLRVRPHQVPPSGAAVLLVDDVVTTGATLRACRVALAGAGVRAEVALVLCDATGGSVDHEIAARQYPLDGCGGRSFGASAQVGVTRRTGLLPNRDAGYRASHPLTLISGGSADRAPGGGKPRRSLQCQPDAESEGSLRGDRCHRP